MTRCVHCGQDLGGSAFLCPRCNRVQPPDGGDRHWYRAREFHTSDGISPGAHLGFAVLAFSVALGLLVVRDVPRLEGGHRIGLALLPGVLAVPWLRELARQADAEASPERERLLHAAIVFVCLGALTGLTVAATALLEVLT